jgi:hypothetical protein
VLEHQGLAAWMRIWRTTTAPRPASRPAAIRGSVAGDEVVTVLADMALACLGGR